MLSLFPFVFEAFVTSYEKQREGKRAAVLLEIQTEREIERDGGGGFCFKQTLACTFFRFFFFCCSVLFLSFLLAFFFLPRVAVSSSVPPPSPPPPPQALR